MGSTHRIKTLIWGIASALAITLLAVHGGTAQVQRGTSQSLGVGVVTSNNILDRTVASIDISTDATSTPSFIATTTANFFVTAAAQTLAGVKTFSSFPSIPTSTPTTDDQAASKKYVDDNVGATTITLTAGEAINNREPVVLGLGNVTTTDMSQYTGGATAGLGNTTSEQAHRLSFSATSSETLVGASFWLGTIGTPTDDLIIGFATSSAVTSTVGFVTSTTIPNALIPADTARFDVVFNATSSLNASTTYYIIIRRSGALNDTNYFEIERATSNLHTRALYAPLDAGAWVDSAALDYKFVTDFETRERNQIYRAGARTISANTGFVGICNATTSAGSTCSVVHRGPISTFSGLVAGRYYYLSNTTGSLQTYAGSSTIRIGFATASTTIMLDQPQFTEESR